MVKKRRTLLRILTAVLILVLSCYGVLGVAVWRGYVYARRAITDNNLRLISNARSRVMVVSNFQDVGSIRKPMVDPLLDSGDMAEMCWPKGVELVTPDGLVPINADTTEADWNGFLHTQHLMVRYEEQLYSSQRDYNRFLTDQNAPEHDQPRD